MGDSGEDWGMKRTIMGWKRRALGELSKTTSGGTPSRKRKDYFGGTIPWVKSGELNDDFIEKTGEHISELGLKNSSAKLFSPGTLLIALYGATVGKTSILRIDAATNQAVCGITPNAELDTEFLRYHLVFLRPELLGHRYGGAQPNISQSIIRNLEVDYPPLPEQKNIAHVLSTVQRTIEAQERIIQTTTELKKALMHKLFTEGLHNEPQKQTEIGPVPESWEIKTVGDYCDLLNGYAFKSEDYVTSGGIPNFRVVNINWDGTISMDDCKFLPEQFADSHERYLLNEGDILFVMVGATRGKLAQIPASILPALMNQNMWRIVPNSYGIDREYLFFHLLRSIVGILKEDEDQARGFFKKSDFKNIPLVIPSMNEQIEIRTVLQTVNAKLGEHATKAARLQDLFRTLLHELMTAKICVHETSM